MMVNMKENVGREDRGGNISSRFPHIDINDNTGKVNPININDRKKHKVPDSSTF